MLLHLKIILFKSYNNSSENYLKAISINLIVEVGFIGKYMIIVYINFILQAFYNDCKSIVFFIYEYMGKLNIL